MTGGQPNPYAAFNLAITGFVPGNSYILDFRETDTAATMNVGVDDVSLNAVVAAVHAPAIGHGLPVALALFGLLFGAKLLERKKMLKPLFLLAEIALLSQPVYAQNANVANAVVPLGSNMPWEARPHSVIMSIGDPDAVVHGPGQTGSCGGNAGQDLCFYNPADINRAYTTSFISNGNGGAGRTVAITDAYFNSQTKSDFAIFSSNFGLPACTIANGCLTIVGQTGGAPRRVAQSNNSHHPGLVPGNGSGRAMGARDRSECPYTARGRQQQQFCGLVCGGDIREGPRGGSHE